MRRWGWRLWGRVKKEGSDLPFCMEETIKGWDCNEGR